MFKVRFLLTRKTGGVSNDDKILVETHGEDDEFFKVTYTTPDISRSRTFVATESRVIDYLEDIVYSLYRDTDPFSHMQVTTCIHPCVMYHVADLYEKDVCDLILNMSADALHLRVRTA